MIYTWIFLICLALVVLFQFALVLGMPWGEFAMGGKYPGKFSTPLRIAAFFQMMILMGFGCIVLSKSSLAFNSWKNFSESAMWWVVGFSVIAAVLNCITPSKKERMIWAPVTLIMLFSSLMIAFTQY